MADDKQAGPELVIAPGGPRERELTRFVAESQAVRQDTDGTLRNVLRAATDAKETSNTMDEELVLTPGGYRPKSRVYFIMQGHSLHLVQGRYKEMDADRNEVADSTLIMGIPSPGQVVR